MSGETRIVERRVGRPAVREDTVLPVKVAVDPLVHRIARTV